MAVYLGGSRSLAPSIQLRQVVIALLSAGQQVHVGCSAGADQQVIQVVLSRPSSFSQLSVHAAFGSGGQGSWSGSAVHAVQSFARAGGSVSWWAGGGQQCPLVARLIQRSIAGLVGASAAVFFQPGPGSLAVASVAVSRGIPVFAFAASAPALPRGVAGAWVRSSFQGFTCWSFQPAQARLF